MNYIIDGTSWGWMGLAVREGAIAAVALPCGSPEEVQAILQRKAPNTGLDSKPDPAAREYFNLLVSYLNGDLRELSIPYIVPNWTTPFQRRVWEIVRNIPYGQTRSYGWIAAEAGIPKGPRAVGQAVGRNPVPLIVPCHRVLAADGSIGGFTGGIEIKRKLLELEKWDRRY